MELKDKRYHYLEKALKEDGYSIFAYGEEETYSDSQIIYVMALTEEVTEEKTVRLKNNSMLFCNKLSDEAAKLIKQKNITYYNVIDNESYVIKNACLTAEGALGYLICNTDTSLKDMPVLIIGYGRVGKALAKIFKDNYLSISVATNDPIEYAHAAMYAEKVFTFSDLHKNINGYKAIVNTVPMIILNEEILKNVGNDCFILDLASKPGGLDYAYAVANKLNYLHALSVPAIVSPKTAALILKDAIIERLDKKI